MKLLVIETIGNSFICSECREMFYSKKATEHAKVHGCDDVIGGACL